MEYGLVSDLRSLINDIRQAHQMYSFLVVLSETHYGASRSKRFTLSLVIGRSRAFIFVNSKMRVRQKSISKNSRYVCAKFRKDLLSYTSFYWLSV